MRKTPLSVVAMYHPQATASVTVLAEVQQRRRGTKSSILIHLCILILARGTQRWLQRTLYECLGDCCELLGPVRDCPAYKPTSVYFKIVELVICRLSVFVEFNGLFFHHGRYLRSGTEHHSYECPRQRGSGHLGTITLHWRTLWRAAYLRRAV